MNELSWMLYFADVLPSIGVTLFFTPLIIGIVLSVSMFGTYLDGYTDANKAIRVATKRVSPFLVMFFVMGLLIPSQKTIYMIVGSQVTEEAIASETGKRVLDAVNRKLDEYISKE